jgi:hypothetical protein
MSFVIQKASLAKVQNIIAAGNRKIEALDPDLKPDAKRERIAAIRLGVLKEMGATRDDMNKRGAAARDGIPFWSQDAARRRAKFADDPTADAQQRMAFAGTLARTSTPELIKHLDDAVRDKSVARAELVRVEFQNRADRKNVSQQFDELFIAVVDPAAKAMEIELGQIAGHAAHAETLIHEFTRGVSNPIERITTARMAGLAKVA